MLIVSQNKVNVLNLDKVNLIGINRDGEIKARLEINDIAVLGIYKTEERAKEVLQEIVSKYKTALYNSKTNETVVNIPKVYEMPTK